MPTLILIMLIGLAGGIAVGLQGPLASLVSQRLGVLESVFIVHLGGAVVALIPLAARRGGHLGHWRAVPWYALGAGALGLVLISALSYTIPRIGASASIMILVMGQLVVGAILDHFGLFGIEVRHMDLTRLAGMLVLFGGVWLTVRK